MNYCHGVILLFYSVYRNANESLKAQQLLRSLKRSIIKKIYPFLSISIQLHFQTDLLYNQPPLAPFSPFQAVFVIRSQQSSLPQALLFVTEDRLKRLKKELATEFLRELSSILST